MSVVLLGCHPDVGGRTCTSSSDCFRGERCVAGACVPNDLGGGSDVGGDSTLDTADQLAFDTDADDGDSRGSDLDVPDLASDPADSIEADRETGDAPDLATCPEENRFSYWMDLPLYEPCLSGAPPPAASSCERDDRTYEDITCSSFPRQQELVEVPLMNGRLDASVLAYFPFEGNLTINKAITGSSVVLNAGSADFNPGLVGQAIWPETAALSVSPFLLANETDWSIAFWFYGCDSGTCDDGPRALFSTRSGEEDADYLSVQLLPGAGEDPDRIAIERYQEASAILEVDLPSEADEQWHHFALAGASGQRPIGYIDGELAQGSWEGSLIAPMADGNDVWFGNSGLSDLSCFTGAFDEIIFANRALSPLEVRVLAESEALLGEPLVSGAEPDWRDVHVLERKDDSFSEVIDSEVIGTRPGPPPGTLVSDCHVPFDDMVLNDFSSTVTNGNCFGLDGGTYDGATLNDPGRFGHEGDLALKLESNAYVELTLQPDLTDEHVGFTVELWIKLGSEGAGTVWSVGELVLSVTNENILFEIGPREISADVDILDDRWHHVAVVFTHPDAGGHITLFVDGLDRVVGCNPGSLCGGLPTDLNSIGSFVRLGEPSDDDGGGMTGYIDDVVIYTHRREGVELRERTTPNIPVLRFFAQAEETEEIECPARFLDYDLFFANAAAPIPTRRFHDRESCVGLLADCAGYVGWWRFESDSVSRLFDSTEHNLHLKTDSCSSPGAVPGLFGLAGAFSTDKCGALRPGDGLHWSLGNPITIQALIYPTWSDDDFVPRQTLLSYESEGANEWRLIIDDTGGLEFRYTPALGGEAVVFNSSDDGDALRRSQWHSISVSHEFGHDLPIVMINDSNVPMTSTSGDPTSAPAEGDTISLGAGRGTSEPLDARIEEIRLLTRTPVAEEWLFAPRAHSSVWRDARLANSTDICLGDD